MKKAIYPVVFAILLCCAPVLVRAADLELGAKLDLKTLSTAARSADNTIVAFVPSLTYDCDYASMLTQSFYYYFDRGMAFETMQKTPDVQVFFVVRDARNEAKSIQNITGRMKIVYDEGGKLFTYFGAKIPAGINGDSTVVLLDSKEKITLIDENYRAQGEHLKPLENKLKELNGISAKKPAPVAPKPLKIGDKAPDFLVKPGQKLSDLRGEVVLISFYPAAFSGSFPAPHVARPTETVVPKKEQATLDPGKFTGVLPPGFLPSEGPSAGSFADFKRRELMSCTFQIDALELKARETNRSVSRIVISSSTLSLLEQWRYALDTRNIIYANDPDYLISKQYHSYNPAGYNNRVSVIVDQKGNIAYIDNSFEVGDDGILEAKISELLNKSK